MTPAGRPEVGAPINVRFGDQLQTRIDNCRKRLGFTSRARTIRALVDAALAELDDETIGRY